MIEIRLAEAAGELDRERMGNDIFAEKFLIKRALLQALELFEGWAGEAESLGAQLVQLSHPGIAAVRKLARVSNRVNHLWTA
jgi:hypothetical protein